MDDVENLFAIDEIKRLTTTIAIEFENRNLFPLIDFHLHTIDIPNNTLNENCIKLNSIIEKIIRNKDTLEKLISFKSISWISTALFFGNKNGTYNLYEVAKYICIALLQKRYRNIDDQIDHLNDIALCKKLNIPIDKNFLIDLSDNRIELKNHGILFNKSALIYPHQFFRRYFSSNFVDMPALLRKIHELGAKVHIRIDPFRITLPQYYQEIIELDHWYGPLFSDSLLMDKNKNDRTLHIRSGYFCFSYDVKFTVFRTKMMDNLIREFMIEEYCPLELPLEGKSPGVGKKYCIQKFAILDSIRKENVSTI